LVEVDLEFLGRQIGMLIEGQHGIRSHLDRVDGHLTAIEDKLAATATPDLPLGFEGQVEVAELRTRSCARRWRPTSRRPKPGLKCWKLRADRMGDVNGSGALMIPSIYQVQLFRYT
jgi:hypothetical protein